MVITEARPAIDEQTASWQALTPVSDEQREKNLKRVLAPATEYIWINRKNIDTALAVLTPNDPKTIPETVHKAEDIAVKPKMTEKEAVMVLGAWAHIGETRETIRDSEKGTVMTFGKEYYPNIPAKDHAK